MVDCGYGMNEKYDWFIYVEGRSWDRNIGYGQHLRDLTEEEARSEAHKFILTEFSDEGCLSGEIDDLIYLYDCGSEDRDATNEFNETLSRLEENVFLFKISSWEKMPLFGIVQTLSTQMKKQAEDTKRSQEEADKELLSILRKKYPNHLD